MLITPIAHISNGFSDKFGIPRQSREESTIESKIIFEPPYRVREALRGMEAFSHLWLIWEFHNLNHSFSTEDASANSWSPTVRPPRLGGNTRMGVFATRSPYRPNRLGLSSVRLLRIEDTEDNGCVLVVSGADLQDGTPIYDIKPYLSFSDSHPDAINGFADDTKDYHLTVEWPTDIEPNKALEEILSQDPRPSYQDDAERIYKLDYAGQHVEFRVEGTTLYVLRLHTLL